jgi:hypothetical protein
MADVVATLHDWRAEIAAELEAAESERPALLAAVARPSGLRPPQPSTGAVLNRGSTAS